MSKVLAVATIVLGIFLTALAVRVEMLRTQNDFLMKLVQLERTPVTAYEAQFGKPMHIARYGGELHPNLQKAVEGKLTEGQTAYFFSAGTLPHKYLIVISNADGDVAWRGWLPM